MSSKPVHIPHELIRDSAGAGKTFKLTNRFIRLLYHGQAPERIIALTFTRKAAGEFFSGILQKLAKAAADPKAFDLSGDTASIDDEHSRRYPRRRRPQWPTALDVQNHSRARRRG